MTREPDAGSARQQSSFGWGRRLVGVSTGIPREALRFLGNSYRWRRRAPPAGARPGEYVVPSDAPRPRIRVMLYAPEAYEERDVEQVEELAAIPGTAGRVAWIDVQGYGDASVLERIREIFEIHPLAVADVVNVPQRPKAELYGDRLLIVTQMARLTEAGDIVVEQVTLLQGPGFVVTFQEQPGDVLDPVRERIRSPTTRIRQMGADFLAYALADAVVDGYFPVMEAIGGIIDALEEEVVERPTRTTLARIHATRRLLLHLHRVQWQQRDALGTLLRDGEFPISEPVRVYLRDAHDHAFQILDAIESYRELSVGLMDVFLSTASNHLNQVMKTLTVVASIFIPLTFIAGVYGMNFQYMPELHWRWGYLAVWGLMVATALGLLAWFRSRGWIGARDREGVTGAGDPSAR